MNWSIPMKIRPTSFKTHRNAFINHVTAENPWHNVHFLKIYNWKSVYGVSPQAQFVCFVINWIRLGFGSN